MRRNGFALIELLVVIAIIVILAAIFFPLFRDAQAKSQDAVCCGRLNSLMPVFLMYVNDHDGKTPPADRPTVWYTFNTTPDIEMYSCPLLGGQAETIAFSELGPSIPITIAFNQAVLDKTWMPDEEVVLAGECLNETGVFSDPDELAYAHGRKRDTPRTCVVMATGRAMATTRTSLTDHFPLEMTYRVLQPGGYTLDYLRNVGARMEVDESGNQVILVPE